MFLVLTAAIAATFEVDLWVPSRHEPGVPDEVATGMRRPVLAVPGQPEGPVASTHPSIVCDVRGGTAWAVMEADAASYPTTFPFSGTCELGGDFVQVTVAAMAPEADPALQPVRFDERLQLAYTRPQGWMVSRAFALPEGPLLVPGSKVLATGVQGVTCESTHDGRGLRLAVDAGATNGDAVCVLAWQDGTAATLAVHLTEAPLVQTPVRRRGQRRGGR
ncbi:MAG: hypothetical protein H6734_12275 [Alphaproteobacteria bacterium]|nr:hypothetical protein [Alphaproteobacteria bacterium]